MVQLLVNRLTDKAVKTKDTIDIHRTMRSVTGFVLFQFLLCIVVYTGVFKANCGTSLRGVRGLRTTLLLMPVDEITLGVTKWSTFIVVKYDDGLASSWDVRGPSIRP